MLKKLTDWLGVYEEEIQLFLWTVLLLFIVRSGGTIIDNYADAVFLKRYGVEYMPVVNMLNAVATVFVMGLVAGLMQRMSGTTLLIRMFLVAGISMLVVRILVPLEISLVYPLLFMMKAQYDILLGLLFWNMANDLFNTQQAKRLFPLITAGGVIGQILGSFGTPWFARTLLFDNLLLAYTVIAISGATAVYLMARRFPTLLSGGSQGSSPGKPKASMMEEFRRVWPLVKESTLIKIMVMLTFLPNVVIPIINYQFNYAVNDSFETEGGLLEFFGYMRGSLNVISLILLLFVGKIYGRWGLPVALMFHPLNYVLAFMSFLFKFDLISALYARMSTQIFRTSINVPATAVVSGLFPQSYRAMIRPFLRGTVVRIGLFLGSTLILLSDKVFHPRYLSLVALPFVITWLTMPFWLKRRYADILTDLVSGDMGDIKSMESADIKQLFRDPSMRRKLRDDFSRSSPADALWFGRLLKTVNDEELDRLIVQKIDAADTDTRVQLMELMTSDDPLAISVLARMALEDVPRQQAAAIGTLARIAPSRLPEGADFSPLIEAPSMEVRAYALAAMLPTDPPRYGAMVRDWIGDPNDSVRMAGVIAAGVSGSQEFVASLTTLLANDVDSGTRAAVLNALNNISPPQINELVQGELVHPSADVRLAAVSAYQVTDKTALQTLIPLLGDTSAAINQQVRTQIVDAPFHDGKQLIRALGTPRRKVREEIFKILDVLDIKDLDVVRFVRGQAEGAYKYLIEAQAVKKLHSCPQRDLLETHLRQQGQVQIENMIRVLATQDTSGKMRIVSRGLLSTDARQHANSLEALGDLLDNAVARFIVPLIDASPTDQKLAAARKFFKLKPFSASNAALIEHLLEHRHWVTRALALEAASGCGVTGISQERLETAQADPESGFIQSAARRLMQVEKISPNNQEERMQANSQETPAQSGSIAISEKILLLNRIDIFAGLSVVELSAIATACEEVDFPPGARVISQNDAGDTLYLIISGKVAVMKTREDGVEMELDQMTSGDYFGEMALFEDSKRSAGIVTLEDTRLLFLHKQEFNDMVREYPQIALAICNALSRRIRRLHQRMEALGSATE